MFNFIINTAGCKQLIPRLFIVSTDASVTVYKHLTSDFIKIVAVLQEKNVFFNKNYAN